MTPILLDPTCRPVIGHRGAAAHAPENTLESFERALADGAEALEMDVHVTADGHIVVIHDDGLERTTDGAGRIAELPLARIRAADAGACFTPDGSAYPFRGRGVRVPTIDEVLERFPSVPLLIELKSAAASEGLRRALARHGATDRVLVGAFDDDALAMFRAPPWHATASQRDVVRLLAHTLTHLPMSDGRYEALSIPPRWHGVPLPIAAIAREARREGRPVHIWTVDDAAEARALWARGVCGIISNDPGAIRAARDAS